MTDNSVRLAVRAGILMLALLGATACQNVKPKAADKPQSAPSVETQRQQREAKRLQQCQQELAALQKINPERYQDNQRAFDSLMSGASQYAGLRARVNDDTQETVDALYRYKVSRLCVEIEQSVLIGLAERGEQVK
ncbi:MAG: hypothetical protein KJJ56_16370 [Serratia rubidaea]|nr:hypothetical protein [Serratia rubidaea]